MRIVLMVFLNLMFLLIVGLYSWAAFKFWNSDRGAALAGAMAALQFLAIWLIAGAGWLVGDNVRDYLWWFIAAIALSTLLRYWAVSRYRRRSRSLTTPQPEGPRTT